MSALFLELAKTVLFPSCSSLTFILRMISLMVVLAPHEEVAKAPPVPRLATHKLFVSVDRVVGLEHLATHLQTNTRQLCYQILCRLGVRRWQRLKSEGENALSLLCCVPPTDPIQQQHYSFANPPWTPPGPGASR